MNKITNFRLQVLWIIAVLLLTPTQPIFAASPSPSSAITEFQQKVEDIKKEAASKAAELKNQVSKTIQNKAFAGNLVTTQDKQLTIQSAKSQKTIITNEYTIIQDANKKQLSLKDLKKDDFLVSLGDVDDNGLMAAKKIVRTKPPAPNDNAVIWGKVNSILVNTISLQKNDNGQVTITTDGSTNFKSGNDEIALADIKVGNLIISVGSKIKNNTTQSQFIYLIKGEKGNKVATASASPSASPRTR